MTGFRVFALAAGCGDGGSDPTAQEILVTLDPVGPEGTGGEASVTKSGDQTNVAINVLVPSGGGEQPAGIYEGTCTNFGDEPAYELPTLQEGTGGITLDVETQALLDGNYVIVAFKSPEDPTPIACGAIEAG